MRRLLSLVLVCAMAVAVMGGCGVVAAESGFNADSGITVVSREEGSGTRGAFIELFGIEVKDADGNKKDTTTKEAVIVNKTDVMLTNVANDPYAIGYVSLGSLNDTVKALAIDGVAANIANVKNGSYKTARPFNIATKGTPDGAVKDFIEFILSKEGQAVIAKSYVAVIDDAPAFMGSKPAGKITIGGSSSVTPIMEKLAEAYNEINANAVIEIQMTDSTAGMTGAIDGTCDIGMASRELKDSEKERLDSITIAIDGIAVIVNTLNPNNGLTSNQVKEVYTGQITNWSELSK